MNERDQEKVFEKLLARTLRASLEPGGAECPGPDILAAYLDRSLGDAEVVRWELHFSSCAHCQQALAVADAGAARVLADERQVATAAAASPAMARAAAPGILRDTQGESRPRRHRPTWRWLVPAVGVAAAVALWITVGPMLRHIESPVANRPAIEAPKEIAQNTQPPSPTVEAPPSARAEIKAKPSAAAPAGTPLAEKAGPAPSQAAGRLGAAMQPSATTTKTERALKRLSAGAGAPENAVGVESQDALRAKKGEPGLAAQVREADSTAAEQVKTGEPAAIAGVPGQAEAGTVAKAQPRLAVSPPSPASGAEAVSKQPERRAAPTPTTFRSSEAPEPGARVIPSPKPSVLWRVGPGGRIERSRDTGRTWQAQAGNVTADLLAGSAPSEMVCWVVGRAGTILRTTDGESWQRVSSPAATDWILVKAQDALNAIVFAANRQGYVTTDGGNSWRGPLEK